MAEFDVNRIADLLRSALNSRNSLANIAYNASLKTQPPVYVVPDGQMPQGRPQYGAETSMHQNIQQNLQNMLGSIKAHQAQSPVYMPFEPGTKTLAGKQFDASEQARAFQEALSEASLMGSYQGKPTMDARRLAQTASEAQWRMQQQEEQNRLGTLFDIWRNTGMAPEGIPGVAPGTELYTAPKAPTRNEVMADALEAVDDAIAQGTSKQDIIASINSQYADLIRQGIDPQSLFDYLNRKELEGAFK